MSGLPSRLTSQSAATNSSVAGTITANGVAGATYYWRFDPKLPNQQFMICARIAGTYAGTLQIQTADPDSTNWALHTAITADATATENIVVIADQDIRIVSVAWTSGAAYVSLSSL